MAKVTAQGKTFNFPEGTSVEQMGSAIDEFFQIQPSAQTIPQPEQQTAGQQDFSQVLTTRARAELSPAQQQQLIQARQQQQNLPGRAPRVARASLAAREETALDKLRSTAPLAQSFARDLPEIGAAPELNEFSMGALRASLAANLIGNEAELGQALQEQIPGSSITQDPEGNLLLKTKSGEFALNKPGLSGQDFVKFATRLLAFAPTSRIVGATTRQLGKGALAGGVTETGLQAGEAAVGGEFDPEQVAVAGAVAPVGQVVGERLIKPFSEKIIKSFKEIKVSKLLSEAAPSAETLKGSARVIYQEIDDIGTRVSQRPINNLIDDIASTLNKAGVDRDLHPKATGLLRRLSEEKNKNLTITELDTLRKIASDVARNIEPGEARLGAIAIDKIDVFLDKIKPIDLIGNKAAGTKLKEARKFWGRAKRAELVDESLTLARDQASGFENGLRTQFRSLLRRIDKGRVKGFTSEEVNAMRTIVQGTNLSNLTKQLGKFGISKDQATNSLMLGLGGAGGFALGGGVGAVAVPAIGTVSRLLSEKLTRGAATFAESIIKAGPNAKEIVRVYLRNVPKNKRSTEELTELLMRPNVNLSTAREIGNKVVDDAIFFARNLQQAAITGNE